jgi:hypothetical protein
MLEPHVQALCLLSDRLHEVPVFRAFHSPDATFRAYVLSERIVTASPSEQKRNATRIAVNSIRLLVVDSSGPLFSTVVSPS